MLTLAWHCWWKCWLPAVWSCSSIRSVSHCEVPWIYVGCVVSIKTLLICLTWLLLLIWWVLCWIRALGRADWTACPVPNCVLQYDLACFTVTAFHCLDLISMLTHSSCVTATGEQPEWVWGAMETQPWRRCFLWTQGQIISRHFLPKLKINLILCGLEKHCNSFCAVADWH